VDSSTMDIQQVIAEVLDKIECYRSSAKS
jgi:hypothetical protein